MDEKRRNVRLSIDIPVKIRFNGLTMPGKSINLSCGGIYVETPKFLDKKDKCDVVLSLPDGQKPMVLQSEVVWLTPKEEPATESTPESQPEDAAGAGLRFQSMDPEQKERINDFIRRNIRDNMH